MFKFLITIQCSQFSSIKHTLCVLFHCFKFFFEQKSNRLYDLHYGIEKEKLKNH